MQFEVEGDRLLSTIDLGEACIEEVQGAIRPDDDQEMCGSYELTSKMVEWLHRRFGKEMPALAAYVLFLERDS
jgi:hypothetical protein